MQKKLGWIYENNLTLYREKWSEIREVLADSPTPEQVLEMLGTVARISSSTYAEAKHRCDAKQNTYPLLSAQAFFENEERRKRCQDKSSSVDNGEKYDAVDYARQIQIELVVRRNAHTADKHQKD